MTYAITKLNQILASKGLTYKDLSLLTGISPKALRNFACGNARTRRGRARIENALGVRVFDEEPQACSSPAIDPQAPCNPTGEAIPSEEGAS